MCYSVFEKGSVQVSFGDRLKEARQKAGLTQSELASKLEVSAAMIAQYETGKRNPKKGTLAKLAEALKLGYSYTKTGEPYFYSFVDTAISSECKTDEKFNATQYADAMKIYLDTFGAMNEAENARHFKAKEALRKSGIVKDAPDIPAEERILRDLEELSAKGKEAAAQRINELTYVPEYRQDSRNKSNELAEALKEHYEGQSSEPKSKD